MSFPINTGIPATNNDPADDQPQMQQNFSNINGYLSVDHVEPGTVGDGFHEQVTMNSNNVPSLPTTHPILFSNKQAPAPGVNLDQLFFYAGGAAAAQASNQYNSTAVSGSTCLFGGLILKWGSASAATANPIAFASAFPNSCFGVVAQPINATGPGTANDYVYVSNFTATGFNATGVRRTQLVANTGFQYFYIAIGN